VGTHNAGQQEGHLAAGYRLDWGGEYTEYLASRGQLQVILPLTLFLIFLLLFALYSNFKFPFINRPGCCAVTPVGGILALWITRHPFLGGLPASAFWPCSASRCRPRPSISR